MGEEISSQVMTGAGDQRRPTVLIVDDQPANVHALARILGADVSTRFALDGEQALVRVTAEPVDLILLDVMMQGLDGFAVCQRLKANPRTAGIPVIFVSGLTEGTDEERGFEVGAVDYIHKPFLPAIVRARVQTHLRLRAALAELERMARLDPLTGLANRRQLDQGLSVMAAETAAEGALMALLIVDVDHFKRINDAVGHGEGDLVLIEVSRRLADAVEAHGLVARWGGEEFACAMRGDDAHAMALAERIRERVASTPIAGRQVTVSIGVALLAPGDDVREAFARADVALFQAKQAGRDRCILAEANAE